MKSLSKPELPPKNLNLLNLSKSNKTENRNASSVTELHTESKNLSQRRVPDNSILNHKNVSEKQEYKAKVSFSEDVTIVNSDEDCNIQIEVNDSEEEECNYLPIIPLCENLHLQNKYTSVETTSTQYDLTGTEHETPPPFPKAYLERPKHTVNSIPSRADSEQNCEESSEDTFDIKISSNKHYSHNISSSIPTGCDSTNANLNIKTKSPGHLSKNVDVSKTSLRSVPRTPSAKFTKETIFPSGSDEENVLANNMLLKSNAKLQLLVKNSKIVRQLSSSPLPPKRTNVSASQSFTEISVLKTTSSDQIEIQYCAKHIVGKELDNEQIPFITTSSADNSGRSPRIVRPLTPPSLLPTSEEYLQPTVNDTDNTLDQIEISNYGENSFESKVANESESRQSLLHSPFQQNVGQNRKSASIDFDSDNQIVVSPTSLRNEGRIRKSSWEVENSVDGNGESMIATIKHALVSKTDKQLIQHNLLPRSERTIVTENFIQMRKDFSTQCNPAITTTQNQHRYAAIILPAPPPEVNRNLKPGINERHNVRKGEKINELNYTNRDMSSPLLPKVRNNTVLLEEQPAAEDLNRRFVTNKDTTFLSALNPEGRQYPQTDSDNNELNITFQESNNAESIYECIDEDKKPDLPNQINQVRTINVSPKLAIIIADLQEKEVNYIDQLQKCLEISQQLRKDNISEKTLDKFFGCLQEILLIHKEHILENLNIHKGLAKSIPLTFLRIFINGDIYIKRQWLVPNEFDLDQFERFLLYRQNLKPYMNIAKEKIKEYVKYLHFFKLYCEGQDTECNELASKAIEVMEDLLYQLEMIDQFKKIENLNATVRQCGKVFLNHTFKVAMNNQKRRMFLVYLCEKMIIFTNQQKSGIYRYVDNLSTSDVYCITKKNKSSTFEIGLRNTKRFVMKTDSQIVKERWCNKLKSLLNLEQFEEG